MHTKHEPPIIKTIRERLSQQETGYRVYYQDDKITIVGNYCGVCVLNFAIDSTDIGNIEELIQFIVVEVSSIERRLCRTIEETGNKILSFKRLAVPKTFTSHTFGKCKYRSLGYIKYAYMRLCADWAPTQWIKLYCRLGKIQYDRTIKELNVMRSADKDTEYSTVPPKIRPCDYPEECLDYLEKNSGSLLDGFAALPLNLLNIREDTKFNKIAFMTRVGDKLSSCRVGEMQDPTTNLYLVAIHNNYSKKIEGFAKKVASNDRPIMLLNGRSNTVPMDPSSILYSDNRRRRYHHTTQYQIGAPIVQEDEYLDSIITDIISKVEAESEANDADSD